MYCLREDDHRHSSPLSKAGRGFLTAVAERGFAVVLPGIVRLEVACALARRLGDPARG